MGDSQVIRIGSVSFKLIEKHDFEWLRNFGEVFCVFDQQDSGNICFGIENDGVKKFVKYAGAKTLKYSGQPEDAIARLRRSIPLYKDLNHPHLTNLVEYFEVETGYALVFDWFNGECLNSESPFYRYKQLPIEYRLESVKSIFEFHVHVEKKNYVAVDFYDGSILYDFNNNMTKICDIDLYMDKPFINTMGRLWGSSRFMSPEEFILGAEIDERTNVFNIGAIAFGLLGGELDRSFLKWEAGQELYEVAVKAVEESRSRRFSSVEEFFLAWTYVSLK